MSHSNSSIAKIPEPPYYAVIFTSERTDGDNGYGAMADHMVELAAGQPGFLGVESARESSGVGITISYWESLEAIKNWKENPLHLVAQRKGQTDWYAEYGVRISRVERQYFL
ncbi:antibiotic biosynthesis monooxygenase [Paenibacillus sp. OV219]|uniref:antibiotic biosynthesis monooxygenase family protein n=1 Tax=Paenibacillus sp. OV219 TaxID=1884377 RepID=UPI0008CD5262|nr:antibiotic biosynthesis monooxygenase [Paenibacillus sp. OV219]SEN84608.1 Heme-degrading monooxygenase HmoA [Paenibacillus sp. OV219]